MTLQAEKDLIFGVGARPRGAALNGTDLTDSDLRGADLTGADPSGANLRGALWSDETAWPSVLYETVRERSERLGTGWWRIT